MLTPKPYEIYKHFKGNCYQIICIATDSEDGSPVVVYQGLYAPYKIYSRKLSMFMEPVDSVKYPDAKQKYRFELLDSEGFVVDRDNMRSSKQLSDGDDVRHIKPDAIEEKSNVDVTEDSKISQQNVINSDIDKHLSYRDNEDAIDMGMEENNGKSEMAGTDKQVNDSCEKNDDDVILNPEKQEEIMRRRAQASQINPILAKFLDAASDDEQLEIIVKYREEITEDILVPMELSLGMEVGEGRLADRIFAIRNSLELKKRYERSNRS